MALTDKRSKDPAPSYSMNGTSMIIIGGICSILVAVLANHALWGPCDGVWNWSWTTCHSYNQFVIPATIGEAASIIAHATAARQKVRVVGARASDFPIRNDVLLSSEKLVGVEWDENNPIEPWFLAGSTVRFVFAELEKRGRTFSLPIWSSDPTIGSLTQVEAHTNGAGYGAMSTVVSGLEIILSNGTLARFSPDSSEWDGVRVGLGMLGMVVRVRIKTLEDWPVLKNGTCTPLDNFLENMERFMSVHKDYIEMEYFAGVPNSHERVFVQGGSRVAPEDVPANMETSVPVPVWKWNVIIVLGWKIQQLAMVLRVYGGGYGAWIADYMSGRTLDTYLDNTLCEASMLQQRVQLLRPFDYEGRHMPALNLFEVFVPREHCLKAVQALVGAMNGTEMGTRHFMNIRPVKSSTAWMSPMHGHDVCGIDMPFSLHFVKYTSREAVMQFHTLVARLLKKFDARPHWGKGIPEYYTPEYLRDLYPKMDAFVALRTALDPAGTFHSGWPF